MRPIAIPVVLVAPSLVAKLKPLPALAALTLRIRGDRSCRMEKVLGIGGVFFRARDPKRLAAWYHQHLGIPGESDWAEFAASDPTRPDPHARTTWALFPEDTDYFGPTRQACMINYRVANLDRMLEQLRRAGVAIEKVEDFDYGRFAWITDPEGNRIELWQPLG